MERSGLINKVKVKLDEFTPGGIGVPFDDYINPLLDESARLLLERGPLRLILPTNIPLTSGTPPLSIVEYADNKAYIPVPTDFIRLYEIKFNLWKKSVRLAISTENPAYKIQENEYIKGGNGRPSVAIIETSINSGIVKKYFECSKLFYSPTETLTPTVATYVKEFKPEELNDQLSDSLIWICTQKVLSILGYADKAVLAMNHFNEALNALIM